MKLDIIIPNYNGCHFLTACLDSLKKQTYTDFSVTVVDNGSTDNSISVLSKQYPEISVIQLTYNRGFSSAVNEGILRTHAPYIMLLNNDTVLAPDCVQHLMESISKGTDIFSSGAHVLNMNNPRRTDTSGDFYTVFGYAFCRGQGLPFHYRKAGEVFTNCGCAAVYRRALLKKTGLFDSGYFAYLEDVDIGFRARRLGYKNVFSPQAVVYHYGSATTGSGYTSFKVYHSARNNIWLCRRNLTLFQRILHSPFLFCGMLLKYQYFKKQGFHRAYLKGSLAGMKKNNPGPPSAHGLKSYIRTEPWLLYSTFLYVFQYIQRKLTY